MGETSLRNRSVFVTGAYGLLGSWLVKALIERGARVTVLRRDSVGGVGADAGGHRAAGRRGRRRRLRRGLIERVLDEDEVDTVFHLAAQAIVGVANHSPVPAFETNIRGTWQLLEACRQVGVRRVVVASSDKAYGAHDELPYREEFALQPRYPYEVAKAATDMIARSYWHTFELPVAVTRFANMYGGGDLHLSRLVPECVLSALHGRAPVIRSDGTSERDYLYVEDAVEAYLAILGLLEDGRGAGEAFNAGGDRPHSALEVAELVCRLAGTGVAPDVRGTGTPPGEVARQWVDSTKLRTMSGWEPTVSLEEGLARTVDWYRDYLPQLGVGAGD